MAYRLTDRIKHAWDIFKSGPPRSVYSDGPSYGRRPDRLRVSIANERSIISSIYTRMAIDAADAQFRHVRLREDGLYLEDIKSTLNECLMVEANLDQSGRFLMFDAMLTLFDKGVVALVPVETNINPATASFDILKLRVGEIIEWKPRHILVRAYDEETGTRKDIWVPKRLAAIVENPLYSVMNEPNSTLQRLIRKLNLLDGIDENIASGKLDLIIQLPYVIKSEARRQQAEVRRKDIEAQLTGSKYGIAYTDGTERITQLNRPAENNLLLQIQELKQELYEHLGLSKEIFSGLAEKDQMMNYYSRTIGPILDAFRDEMYRKFLTKTARSQRQSIKYFRDPFKLVSPMDLAEIVDKFTRNEIASSNEFRGVLGWVPSKDPKADELVNSNLNQSKNPGRIEAPLEKQKQLEAPGRQKT